MVVEEFLNFGQWLPAAIWVFLLLVVAMTVLGVFFGYLVAAFRHGPSEGFYVVAQTIGGAFPDAMGTSPRRILAIARLAMTEAFRRRIVLVTFAVFALAMLFGGWFMNSGSDHPDQVYINFVLWGTQLLVLMMGMLIAAFSLPDDIKNKTIYTVVTKPVRATEIVFGRIVGFAAIGTLMIAVMGLLSFFFVWRGLSHTHQVVGDTQTVVSLDPVDPVTRLNRQKQRASESAIKSGETTSDSGHRHPIELIEDIREADSLPIDRNNIVSKTELPDGRIRYERLMVNPVSGHTHSAIVTGEGENARIEIGPSNGYFRSRIPIYADSLIYYDSSGTIKNEGTNVGQEWSHKGFVDGGTQMNRNSLAKAVFSFENFSMENFSKPDLLILELNLGVFRTYKGDIEKRVIGSLQFESEPDNPGFENKFQSELILFETEEFQVQMLPIKRKLLGQMISPDGEIVSTGQYDLFDEFAKNGKLKISLRCQDQNQYLGAAREDIYFRARDGIYWVNFTKGFIGIWAQMLVIVSLGVALSTFLSAPVTVVGTLVMMIVGFSTPFIREMMAPDSSGGGPIESFYRIITQKNMETDLEPGVATTLLEQTDFLLVNLLSSLTYIAPNFSSLNFSDFLMHGYSVDIHRLAAAMSIAISFCIGLTVFGYFCLKTREIAK